MTARNGMDGQHRPTDGGNPDTDPHAIPRAASRGALWSTAPLILVMLALVGSLAVPARQTWLITQTLRQSTDLIAPTRLLVGQLQTALAGELLTLQSYALSGDETKLTLYETAAAETRQRLLTLGPLAKGFDTPWRARTDTLQSRITGWHRSNEALLAQRRSRARFVEMLEAEAPQYDSSMAVIAGLSSGLATVSETRDDRVSALERMSIISNAVLVLVALVAMTGVVILTLRERRLTATLRRRVEEESALRQAAGALSDAYTVDDVTQRIAESALEAVAAGRGAFVELIEQPSHDDSKSVVVRSVAGVGAPLNGATAPYAGSSAETVTTSGTPMLIGDLAGLGSSGIIATMPNAHGSAIVVPLGSETTTMGALFVLSSASGHFHSGDVARAGIFGHLAALAYEKVRLLNEAQAQQRALERVIQSRSRLMRGFSHDVKNPIGAADGFAELLSMGVYGALTAEQQASIGRMRRCIHTALGLIDDLHELARAETGHLALKLMPLDLAVLALSLGEEYDGAAHGRGLSLTVEVEQPGLTVEADGPRVRQIVSNLLSNAIKYTERGLITLRVREQRPESSSSQDGWAAMDVIDSGIGIPSDKRDFIFEEFNRLDTGTTSGAGLGLAISKLLAESLGGHISVASEPGHGSTFTLWLPLHNNVSE
ncbi:MAG: GAF domain-containing sensor histidine kinase [Gemmatimonadaceae bacterium]